MKRSEQGFTLLEMLVAVVLLATLMVMLADGIGLVSHHLDRSIAQRDRATTMALVQNYLRTALSQALPIAVASDTAAAIDFDGDADGLSFVSRAPRSAPLGGVMRLGLHFDPGKRGGPGTLRLVWQPYRDLGSDDQLGESRSGARPLLTGVSAAAFAYFDPGAADRQRGWRDDWHSMPTLPTLVRISASFSDGEPMPDLVVALRLATAAANPTAAAPQKTQ